MSRVNTSVLWDYFETTNKIEKKARCLQCDEIYSYKGSTGNLKAHLKKKHKRAFNLVSQAQEAERQGSTVLNLKKHLGKEYIDVTSENGQQDPDDDTYFIIEDHIEEEVLEEALDDSDREWQISAASPDSSETDVNKTCRELVREHRTEENSKRSISEPELSRVHSIPQSLWQKKLQRRKKELTQNDCSKNNRGFKQITQAKLELLKLQTSSAAIDLKIKRMQLRETIKQNAFNEVMRKKQLKLINVTLDS